MKFRFKIQQYQTDAVDSVVRAFNGQPYSSGVSYRRDIGEVKPLIEPGAPVQLSIISPEQPSFFDVEPVDDTGYLNESLVLTDAQLLHNIHDIQQENNIRLSDGLIKTHGRCSLDVEMETGTGKTYVYIKTMFELNKRYGWSKFIVVVPSIAIREGVKKSFEITVDHFMEHYGMTAASLQRKSMGRLLIKLSQPQKPFRITFSPMAAQKRAWNANLWRHWMDPRT